jgi:hypothetical protein
MMAFSGLLAVGDRLMRAGASLANPVDADHGLIHGAAPASNSAMIRAETSA